MNDPLVPRFEQLLDPGTPDWLDVRRRVRRSRRPLVLAVAAVALLVAAPALAIAIRGGVLPWTDAEPAPETVVQRFADFDRAFRKQVFAEIHGQAPFDLGILADEARAIPLPGEAVVYVAPRRDGRFCALYERPPSRFAPFCGYGVPGRAVASNFAVGRGGTDGAWVFTHVHGHVSADPSSTLELLFADGTTETVAVTWIGPPIDAGFFVVELDPDVRLEALVLRDRQANELERDTHLAGLYELFASMPGASPAPAAPNAPTRGVITAPPPSSG